MAKHLFTIGYEGAEIGDFLATLMAHEISRVVDVRDVPISRKRGFSKNLLREALSEKGIDYVHLKGLGDPKPGRDAARRGDFSAFRKIYSLHLKTIDAQAALDAAQKLALDRVSCLLCFERDNKHCHRSIVASRLADNSKVTIRHIGVRVGIGTTRKIKDGHPLHSFAIR